MTRSAANLDDFFPLPVSRFLANTLFGFLLRSHLFSLFPPAPFRSDRATLSSRKFSAGGLLCDEKELFFPLPIHDVFFFPSLVDTDPFKPLFRSLP